LGALVVNAIEPRVAIFEAGRHLLGAKPFEIDLDANKRIIAAVASHPKLLVRCSSEMPFFPGGQAAARWTAATSALRYGPGTVRLVLPCSSTGPCKHTPLKSSTCRPMAWRALGRRHPRRCEAAFSSGANPVVTCATSWATTASRVCGARIVKSG